jgi:hypothetical protein
VIQQSKSSETTEELTDFVARAPELLLGSTNYGLDHSPSQRALHDQRALR